MSIGSRKPHESAVGHVTGSAVYTDEQRRPAQMLSVYPVTAPYAHARILSIDISAALALPGCVTVLTAADVPGCNNTGVIVNDEMLFPTETVSHWGQAVVWAVGTTELAARQAAEKVVVSYEPLEPVLTIEAAIATQSFHTCPQTICRGEPQLALRSAAHQLSGELAVNPQDHFYLETQTSWVIPDGEGHYQVYSSTQHPTETQTIVAQVLGLSRNQVVVTCLRMGGAFGGKESQANPYARDRRDRSPQNRLPRADQAQPRTGHDPHRQAPWLFRTLRSGVYRRGKNHRPRCRPLRRWWLEPRSLTACVVAGDATY